jgi:hypothetical protein
MARVDNTKAFDDDDLALEWQARATPRDTNGAISGILIAVGCSLLLWAGLAQIARLAARAIL